MLTPFVTKLMYPDNPEYVPTEDEIAAAKNTFARTIRMSSQTTLTADEAKTMLLTNTSNRKISEVRLNELVRALKEGRFKINGDTIRFDVNGTLLDGQHRLLALVITGMSIDTTIVFGLDPEVRSTIDIGTRRQAWHTVGMEGVADPQLVASIAKQTLEYRNPGTTVTPDLVVDFTMENLPSLQLAAGQLRAMKFGGRDGISLKMAGTLLHESGELHEEALVFLRRYQEKTMLEQGSPILLLIRFVENARLGSKRPAGKTYFALLIKAFNAFATDKEIKHLSFRDRGDKRRESFPKIVNSRTNHVEDEKQSIQEDLEKLNSISDDVESAERIPAWAN